MALPEALELPPSISAPDTAQPIPVETVNTRPSQTIPDDIVPDALPTASHGAHNADNPTETQNTINSTGAERLSRAPADSPLNVVGWDDDQEHLPIQIVRGLPNDTLWMLLRRFNGQVQHVKAVESVPHGRIDLEASREEEFSPSKLRTQAERFYYTIIVSLFRFANHIGLLRSWKHKKRSAIWCTTYFTLWALNVIWPALAALTILIIVHPPTRHVLFPPAPIIAETQSARNGQKSKDLKSVDSLTDAEENHEGEAAEREASEFVASLGTILLSAVLGKTKDQIDGPIENKVPDPIQAVTTVVESQRKTRQEISAEVEKEKKHIRAGMWKNVRPVMRALQDATDGWERFSNALNPTSPYRDTARFRLAGVVAGILLVSLFINPTIISRAVGFLVGFGFFGQPLISRGIHWLNVNIPDWTEYLELRNTLLLGVPTNAQLTLTLLRLGEAEKTPLPPPPFSADPSGDFQREEEVVDVSSESDSDGDIPEVDGEKPQKKRKRFTHALHLAAQGGVNTVLRADKLKAKAGSEHSKQRLGALSEGKDGLVEAKVKDGPTQFRARLHGNKGHLYIDSAKEDAPFLTFAEENLMTKDSATLSIPLAKIVEIKKVDGFGFVSKLVVGSLLNKEIADSLEIVDSLGEKHIFTAIPRRNELFNRTIAVTGQKWEAL